MQTNTYNLAQKRNKTIKQHMNSNKSINQEAIGTVYGPPPIEMDSYQKPQPTIYGPPQRKKLSCTLVSLIIGAIIGCVIAWLLIDCSGYNQPTVYGPPPVDSTQIVSPVNNE